MADYITTDTDLTAVANAIRTKGGTNASLSFPSGFVSAVESLPEIKEKTITLPSSSKTVYSRSFGSVGTITDSNIQITSVTGNPNTVYLTYRAAGGYNVSVYNNTTSNLTVSKNGISITYTYV